MATATYAALFFTVVLLVTTAYFLMGGLPLLVLQHDTPVDARFIRGFFNIYYKAVFVAAAGAAASYALAAKPAFALGVAALAAFTLLLRRTLLPAMEQMATQMASSGSVAIQRFRRLHAIALGVNLVQLVVIVWGITQVRL